MHKLLEYIWVDVVDSVPVEVEVLEPSQAIEGTRAELTELVIVQQEGAQLLQVFQLSGDQLTNVIEAEISVEDLRKVII